MVNLTLLITLQSVLVVKLDANFDVLMLAKISLFIMLDFLFGPDQEHAKCTKIHFGL